MLGVSTIRRQNVKHIEGTLNFINETGHKRSFEKLWYCEYCTTHDLFVVKMSRAVPQQKTNSVAKVLFSIFLIRYSRMIEWDARIIHEMVFIRTSTKLRRVWLFFFFLKQLRIFFHVFMGEFLRMMMKGHLFININRLQ